MAELYSSGDWTVKKGREKQFIAAWEQLISWSRDNAPGFDNAHLVHDEGDPRHFVSFAHWNDADSLRKWKEMPGFMERFAACRSLCDEFRGGDFVEEVAVTT